MNDTNTLDRVHYMILKQMAESGQAPHYTEIAAELGVSPEEGRQALHRLFASGVYGWLYPKTDLIASYAPFNNQPTQFRVTVEGEQQ